ncbi:MAG: hypothetical protein K2Y37_17300 [Pirellulales bacterium]|nr:hypothetical protein [Pirellulales bacterium]
MSTVAGNVSAAEPLDVSARRELFVDRYLIDSLTGGELRLHEPRSAGTAIKFDQPWEGAFCGYVTVLKDGDTYRMYYRGLPSAGKDGSSAEVTCYAESRDAINWTKPNLRIHEVAGTLDNNVILKDQAPATHNFSPFVDGRPDCPSDQRYKALGGTSDSGLLAFVSADGVHWHKLQDAPVFRDTGWVFDSQNVSFWSPVEKRYVLYYRRSPSGVRAIARVTSSDFLSWSPPVQMTFGETPAEHLYTNQTHPYYRAPQIYLGVAARFMPGRKVITEDQARQIGVDPGYFGDCSDAVLLSTRGGSRYERTFMESFVRPGPGLENWVSRTNYPALGIVPTGDDQMSLYVQRNYGQPTARLDRFTLRPDGFASVHAPYAGCELVTKPLRFQSATTGADGVAATDAPSMQLLLNVATSAAGSVRVEIQDAEGKPLPGFALDDCIEIIGDELDRVVAWKGGGLSALAGKPIRLRIALKDADVYAIKFP